MIIATRQQVTDKQIRARSSVYVDAGDRAFFLGQLRGHQLAQYASTDERHKRGLKIYHVVWGWSVPGTHMKIGEAGSVQLFLLVCL